jgi:hypothetical protein
MMQRVGRHDMPHRTEGVDCGRKLLGQRDRRPDEKAAVGEAHQRHARRVGKAEEGHHRTFGDPDVRTELTHEFPFFVS